MRERPGRRFLDPNILAKIANMELISKFVVEGFISGLHKSPYHGFSVEFAQYRPYMPGDELRYIDWKVFARTDRYYVKQFEEETNLSCYLLLDTSGSMGYKSDGLTKLEYGSFLTASLAYFMIRQRDAVGFVHFDESLNEFFPAKSSAAHLHDILVALEKIEPGTQSSIAEPLHRIADRLSKRSLVILISDLYDKYTERPIDEVVETVMDGLAHLRYDGHEVIVFNVFDHQEVEFKFERLMRFVDMETDEEITTRPEVIRGGYLAQIKEFTGKMKSECSMKAIDYNVLDTSIPLDFALLSYLAKREGLM
ncbi:MAG: DUF58 domain-containing protein [Candidatus Poribacteria bacterium]